MEQAQEILTKHQIDVVLDARNLAWGLNWDHSLEYAKAVAEALANADRQGGKAAVERVLKEIEMILNRGKKFRRLP